MASKKNKSKSLSEQIAESFEPRPIRDPELDSEDETAAKVVDFDDDDDYELGTRNTALSDIRKRNVKLLSEYSDKYSGEVVSRKELEDSEESTNEQNEGSSQSDEDDLEEYRNRLKNYQIDSEPDEFLGTDEESEEEGDESKNKTEQDDSDYDSSGSGDAESDEQSEEEDDKGGAELLKETNQTADIQKGLSVQNQLKIWEKLLEVRIHSQKMLINANSLPLPDAFRNFCENNKDFLKLAHEAQQNVSGLLEKMIEMQQVLLKQYPETKNLVKSSAIKRKKIDEEDEIPTKKFAKELNDAFENFHDYRNSVLLKWHDRTKILTPGASSKGKSQSNNFDVVKKIEAVLFNKNELIKKSQTVKSNYTIFGKKTVDNEDNNQDDKQENKTDKEPSVICSEIYDDTDFYHQQLRELIEFKTNNLSNPAEISKQFAELQKLRHKMKKKVDTRASKGRKIRYVVHNKLVNFMAPNDNSTWTEETKDELYRSLFSA